MTVNHRKQGKFLSTKVYECICKFYECLHKAELYNEDEDDAHRFIPITDPAAFPSDTLGLHNHIQISNLYTMSPANGKDEESKLKLQCLTYVVLRITTKYAFEHIIGLIQSYLNEMYIFVKEKEMPSLNTRTCLANIGMTVDWCSVSLWLNLHKDLEQHVEVLQKSGQEEPKYCQMGVPAFLLYKNKMQMPKMNTLFSKARCGFY
jgi:hypothetical protein